MFATYFLKRALPFALTLIFGTLLGGFFNPFGSRGIESTEGVFTMRSKRACSSGYGRRARRAAVNTTDAVITFKPAPQYTEEARRNNFRGTLRLHVLVDADGKVAEVLPMNELPYGLTEEGLRAARGMEFNPATEDGKPTAAWVSVEQNFIIAGAMTTATQEKGPHAGR